MNSAPRLKVMLVDDDEEDFIVIRDMMSDLPEANITIEWESNFDAAKDTILHKQYDAYLVDYRLGAATGIDLMTSIKDRLRSDTPFILLTGQGDHEVDVAAMEKGAADYLVKSQLSGHLLERSIRYAIKRTQIMQELRDREDGVRSIFDATFEGILVFSPDGRILDSNRTADKTLGDDGLRLVGKDVFTFFSKESVDQLLSHSHSHESAPRRFKTLTKTATGKSIHLEIAVKRYSYKGTPAILAACNDISERLNMEAQILQQDRLASIGLLASSLAHEIGTPLGVMRGRAEFILMQAEQESAVAKNANIIVAQIDRISKLIHSLLTLARGEKQQSVASIDASTVLQDVLDLLAHEFARAQVDIQNLVPKSTIVRAASGPLHQVLLNLLVNSLHAIQSAVKSGRASGHCVTISATNSGAWCRLAITDTGSGISEANMKELFKPFFTTKAIGVGTGLGLATSYRILESWDASIDVTSQLNVGTTFTLVLSRADSISAN